MPAGNYRIVHIRNIHVHFLAFPKQLACPDVKQYFAIIFYVKAEPMLAPISLDIDVFSTKALTIILTRLLFKTQAVSYK